MCTPHGAHEVVETGLTCFPAPPPRHPRSNTPRMSTEPWPPRGRGLPQTERILEEKRGKEGEEREGGREKRGRRDGRKGRMKEKGTDLLK